MNGNKIICSQTALKGSCYLVTDYLSLFKIQLCLYISLSAILGHVMAAQSFSFGSLLLGFFVLILACGSAVLNNVQDREYDRFFKRTSHRSLPQQKVSVLHAKIICLAMIVCGLSGLLFGTGFAPFFWGVMAVFFYNGLYTPLKKRSLLAIIFGSISGMLPPLIGWAATEKSMLDPDILILMGVFGLWQISHFFIILLNTMHHKSKTDYPNSFPCFTNIFSHNEIRLQIMIWTSFFSLAILLFLMNGSIENYLLSIFSGLNAVIIVFLVSTLLSKNKKQNISIAFAAINLSMLFFIGTGICDKCLLTFYSIQ
ncbi:MAG: UbiA family prenyltransferase [Deltaproteobacteria bacterium]|uniref:protoheme IX farnesyltransferase n=1 Tax=Desulfobacula sp. TaxID=2593537 RepID=UPI0019B1EED3|nr:UbiA family prenyltransferase [Candidatus Desulfobacula maris]MBL6994526.1 UbiA family prenyltransferase [Desulfobacula sp.]